MTSKTFTLGVAGGSGSGKTSLTRALVAALGEQGCAVLDHDSYYRDLSHQPLAIRAGANFDHPDSLDSDLLAHHIRELLAGRGIDRPCYDFSTHTRLLTTQRIEPRPVVICEGILLLAAAELRAAFQLRLYIDTPADVRALRRLQRDVTERGRTISSVVKQYLDTVRPMHERFVEPARGTADIMLDWRHTPAEQAQQVITAMRELQGSEPLTVSGQ